MWPLVVACPAWPWPSSAGSPRSAELATRFSRPPSRAFGNGRPPAVALGIPWPFSLHPDDRQRSGGQVSAYACLPACLRIHTRFRAHEAKQGTCSVLYGVRAPTLHICTPYLYSVPVLSTSVQPPRMPLSLIIASWRPPPASSRRKARRPVQALCWTSCTDYSPPDTRCPHIAEDLICEISPSAPPDPSLQGLILCRLISTVDVDIYNTRACV